MSGYRAAKSSRARSWRTPARLPGPSELDEQACERRPMERIPGKFVDRQPNVWLLVGQLPSLALKEEPMKPCRRHVVPGEREVRFGIRLLPDELLRGREVPLQERHQRARGDPEPEMTRLTKVHDETMHLVRLPSGRGHVRQLRVAQPQHHLGVDQAFAVAELGRKLGHLTGKVETNLRVLGPPDRPEPTGERVCQSGRVLDGSRQRPPPGG